MSEIDKINKGGQTRRLNKISVVVPVYNEEEVIREFIRRLEAVLLKIGSDYEIIFAIDRGEDQTYDIIRENIARNPKIKLMTFSRRVGQLIALFAGLRKAEGDVVVVIDGDLQDPPEAIETLVDRWKEGYDVAYVQHANRASGSFFYDFCAFVFYKTLRYFAKTEIPNNAGLFRLLDRRVADILKQSDERPPFIRGLTPLIGFKQIAVKVPRSKRIAGKTKYNYGRLAEIAVQIITSFSTAPLRISIYLGAFVSFVSIIVGLVYTFARIFKAEMFQEGWASLWIGLLFFSAINLISIGILSHYVSRLYEDSKRRPLYIVDEIIDLEKSEKQNAPTPDEVRDALNILQRYSEVMSRNNPKEE